MPLDKRSAISVVMAIVLAAVIPLLWRLPLPVPEGQAVISVDPWPLPDIGDDPSSTGPVMVQVVWRVGEERSSEFLADVGQLRRLRRRTGAISWRIYRDPGDLTALIETFVVGSWEEHERQHARLSPADLETIDAASELTENPTERPVRHLLAVPTGRHSARYEPKAGPRQLG